MADVAIGFVLELDRSARMVAQHAVDPSLPGLDEVLNRLATATLGARTANPYEAEIRRAEARVLVDRVTWLAGAAPNPQVRAIASAWLSSALGLMAAVDDGDSAQIALLAADIKRFLERPAPTAALMPAAPQPPGAPIGDIGMDFLGLPPACGWRAW